MSTGASPTLANLDLEADGASPWGDERSINTSTPPISLPHDDSADAFRDSRSEAKESKLNKDVGEPSPLPSTRTSVARRNPRRPGRHVARIEAIDDDLGPLGPLGDNFNDNIDTAPAAKSRHDSPPEPPQKEDSPRMARAIPGAQNRMSLTGDSMDTVPLDDSGVEVHEGGYRRPPATDFAQIVGREALGESLPPPKPAGDQPASPSFEIHVGDPHKVGDLTSAHTVYQVRTKTTSKAYRNSEFTVSRRYRDFLWLYQALINNNPGVVVPPPPEKQAVGRFDDNFVESRRAALERMLNKTAAHPMLQHDADLKLFLESEALSGDIKHKEKQVQPVGENKGMFGSLGGAFGGGGKFIENDEWFLDRKHYLDTLESQLKALLKSVDTVIKQRKDLADAANDFSSSLQALSTVELNKSLSNPLESLSYLQIRIKELHERQAQQDVLTLGITVEEYIRIIGSIKLAFNQRQKAFHTYHAADGELAKRRVTYEKLQRQGKTQQDRLTQMSAEVSDSEKKLHAARVAFDNMGRTLRAELDRFEREKVEDFKSAVETFLESSVEAQKELIELWETYLMQLDREEEEESGYRPAETA
ncbi:putative vacuolar protein sorting-associated protein (vps5) [Tuber indicum]|nr:putative vacuolar protein sorting-associated protein (vps5) [Tuber indicum]